jgi:hypothetical protein
MKSLWKPALSVAVGVASTLAAGDFAAAQKQPSSQSDWLFVSTNRNVGELGEELTRLYVTLFNTGRLSVREVAIPATLPAPEIDDVFVSEKLFYGDARDPFPQRLNSIACDLNRHVCQRHLVPTYSKEAMSQSSHVGGNFPSSGRWQSLAGKSLLLPAIRFEEQRRWATVYKSSTRTLADLVERELRGCPQLDRRCAESIGLANRKEGDKVLAPGYEGPVSLPLLRLQARLNVATADELAKSGASPEMVTLDRPAGALRLIREPGGMGYKIVMESLAAFEAKPASDLNVLFREIGKNLVGSAQGSIQSDGPTRLFTDDFQSSQQNLMRHIGIAWQKPEDYPPYAKAAAVAVFDRWVDGDHCAFDTPRVKVNNIGARSADSRHQCDHELKANEDDDHGTHVAGLVGARSQGSFGVNPFAKVVTFEVDLDGELLKETTLADIAAKLADIRDTHRVDVVNLSFGYMPRSPLLNDPVESGIAAQESLLFVAAAGNHRSNKTNICDLRPACFNLPNVIAVAALAGGQDAPVLHPKSNYGMPIHIAAYGEEVFSTISGGRYGKMSGTSQAAPLVSGVASMLMASRKTLTPQAVKNRLIYCSDHIPALKDKLFGGRLNADCVLDSKVSRLRTKSAVGAAPLKGKLQIGDTVRFVHAESGREVNIPVKVLRGIYYDPDDQTHLIYFIGDDGSKLLREANLRVQPDTQVLKFVAQGTAQVRDVKLADVFAYASSEPD